MSDKTSAETRPSFIRQHAELARNYKVEEFAHQPEPVGRLLNDYEIALDTAAQYDALYDELRDKVQELEIEKRTQQLRIEQMSREASLAFATSLMALVCIALGANLATKNPYDFTGWIIITFGVLAQAISFFQRSRSKKGGPEKTQKSTTE